MRQLHIIHETASFLHILIQVRNIVTDLLIQQGEIEDDGREVGNEHICHAEELVQVRIVHVIDAPVIAQLLMLEQRMQLVEQRITAAQLLHQLMQIDRHLLHALIDISPEGRRIQQQLFPLPFRMLRKQLLSGRADERIIQQMVQTRHASDRHMLLADIECLTVRLLPVCAVADDLIIIGDRVFPMDGVAKFLDRAGRMPNL